MREGSGGENGRMAFLRALHTDARTRFLRYDIAGAQSVTDDALEVAINLRSRPYFLELMDMRVSLNMFTQDISAAAADCHDLLDELRGHSSGLNDADENDADEVVTHSVAREVRALLQYAGIALLLNQPDLTEQLLNRASHLLQPDVTQGPSNLIPNRELLSTRILYTHSLLAAARGDAAAAWVPAIESARRFHLVGHTGNAARAEVHAVDTLLDFARGLPHGTDSLRFALMAKSHLLSAVQCAREADDEGLCDLAILAGARVVRALHGVEDRVGLIRGVIDRAERTHDIMLLAQAYTGLGEELADRDGIESALACYRRALTFLEEGDFPFLGLQARRAILRYEELGTL